MAVRPIFIPNFSGRALVVTRMVEFTWFPGMSVKQKQRSIEALHQAAVNVGLDNLLEISTKSTNEYGVALSAFNLGFKSQKNARQFTVESVFQGSKIFECGGPFIDIYQASPREAKRDERLRNSGSLIGFSFFRERWPLEPKTAFYDWIYLNTLKKNPDLSSILPNYHAFTDIEFNPERSINCQAYSAALYCSLRKRDLLEQALSSKESFLTILREGSSTSRRQHSMQSALNI
jgi:hypothetical protein